jgi:hypothetical protein
VRVIVSIINIFIISNFRIGEYVSYGTVCVLYCETASSSLSYEGRVRDGYIVCIGKSIQIIITILYFFLKSFYGSFFFEGGNISNTIKFIAGESVLLCSKEESFILQSVSILIVIYILAYGSIGIL